MTINKSQGQSLESVRLYLPKPVFSHGQLYIAISRVKSKKGLKILIHDKDGNPLKSITNVANSIFALFNCVLTLGGTRMCGKSKVAQLGKWFTEER
ncbi:hypothetical protein Lal_00023958 [Lupinus albus]|nr:hypothetical protein Lal_00023958 [Lupinus albus]